MAKIKVYLFLVQLAATLFMTGLIWFVQIVHYPLFAAVGEAAFVPYEQRHATLTGYVVALPMLFELLTAGLALSPAFRAAFVSPAQALGSAMLVLLLWAVTGLVQVPLHNQLGHTRDALLIASLVAGNWVRTAAWTLRSGLLLTCLAGSLLDRS